MGRKAHPATIGAFVVGAIVLAFAGLLVFGSGQLFKHTTPFVCFFPGAVDGLRVGAPVKLKGVQIGSVTDIRLRFGPGKTLNAADVSKGIRIPVFIEIDRDKLISQGAQGNIENPMHVKELIDLGLRAQLNTESLVTGLLFVQLDFHPNTPATFVLPPGSKLAEIPTIPTQMEQVQSAAAAMIRKLEELHLDALVKSANETLEAIKQVAGAPGVQKALALLPETVANVNRTVASVRDLTRRLDAKQGPLITSLQDTANKAGATLEQARLTLRTVQAFANPGSPLASQLLQSLQEVGGAARSLRLLADYLERNPSAIVRGRDTNGK